MSEYLLRFKITIPCIHSFYIEAKKRKEKKLKSPHIDSEVLESWHLTINSFNNSQILLKKKKA